MNKVLVFQIHCLGCGYKGLAISSPRCPVCEKMTNVKSKGKYVSVITALERMNKEIVFNRNNINIIAKNIQGD